MKTFGGEGRDKSGEEKRRLSPSCSTQNPKRVKIVDKAGCQLCMGHAVDKDLLSLVQREVKGIITDLTLHDARLDEVEEKFKVEEETRREEIERILARLMSAEKTLSEDLSRRVQRVEERLAATNNNVAKLEQGFAIREIAKWKNYSMVLLRQMTN
ncbi:hypothetical protein OS493_004755 [Desmophyllum pertusum]|uniref:Uncharacterized protein n=1 Tax=Desmophyllum pertusum TaxID=174260 RepID=A0A9W9ZGK5_9CNID|nr:hypothetical protein OS493_004755 [Desmophyllum pertusum]